MKHFWIFLEFPPDNSEVPKGMPSLLEMLNNRDFLSEGLLRIDQSLALYRESEKG